LPDSGSDILHRLIASAQSGLADALPLTEARRRRDLIAAARVQAECAQALATQELADAVRALVVTEGEHDG